MPDISQQIHQLQPMPHARYPEFSRLLFPLQVRGLQLRNRLFFPAMGVDLACPDGCFSDELFDFYSGIFDGGCGLAILGNASVSPDSLLQANGLRLHDEKQALSLQKIIRRSEQSGVCLGVQLQHYGGQGATTHTNGRAMLTPSGMPCTSLMRRDSHYRVRAMNDDDIDTVKRQFINAARLADQAGARLIQLQASNGYLLGSFQSPATNRRTDQYGGDSLARGRLLLEVIAGIRSEIRSDIVLGIRLGADDYLGAEGTRPEDFEKLIPFYEDAGVDLIEVSICTADTFSVLAGDSQDVSAHLQSVTKTIKGYSRVPVGFAGLVRSIEQAEDILRHEVADYVGMARALFADNDLLKKTLEDRRNEIHHCLWDGNCFKDKHNPRYQRVYCCVNPKYKRPQ